MIMHKRFVCIAFVLGSIDLAAAAPARVAETTSTDVSPTTFIEPEVSNSHSFIMSPVSEATFQSIEHALHADMTPASRAEAHAVALFVAELQLKSAMSQLLAKGSVSQLGARDNQTAPVEAAGNISAPAVAAGWAVYKRVLELSHSLNEAVLGLENSIVRLNHLSSTQHLNTTSSLSVADVHHIVISSLSDSLQALRAEESRQVADEPALAPLIAQFATDLSEEQSLLDAASLLDDELEAQAETEQTEQMGTADEDNLAIDELLSEQEGGGNLVLPKDAQVRNQTLLEPNLMSV